MVATLIYAGLRREELLWLTCDDVDLVRRHGGNGMLRIRAKTIDGETWQPKTQVNRAVPISAALREILKTYQSPVSTEDRHPDNRSVRRGFGVDQRPSRNRSRAGGSAQPSQIYDRIAAHFPDMTPEDREVQLRAGNNKFQNHVQWGPAASRPTVD